MNAPELNLPRPPVGQPVQPGQGPSRSPARAGTIFRSLARVHLRRRFSEPVRLGDVIARGEERLMVVGVVEQQVGPWLDIEATCVNAEGK